MKQERGGQWTTTRAVARDTTASPNSLETHLVGKWRGIEQQRTVGTRKNLIKKVSRKH